MADGDIGVLVSRNNGQWVISEHIWAITPSDDIPYLECLRPTWWEIWKIKVAFKLLRGIAKNRVHHVTFPRRP